VHINTNIRRLVRTLSVLVGLLVCGTSQAALNVFACEPEWAALAKELGGDRLDVYSATTAMQDPHHVQARPSLIAKTRRADLVVCSGADGCHCCYVKRETARLCHRVVSFLLPIMWRS